MKERGQVWIETVLYTLIGLALIGLALAFISPRITDQKDKLAVDQTIESLNTLDQKINAVVDGGNGNRREVEFTIKRGELYVDSPENKIVFVITDLTKPYSEPGVEIQYGRIKIMSTQGAKTSSVNLTLDYSQDITYMEQDTVQKFSASGTPYSFFITNNGMNISIEEVSGK